ncbi:MAG TPA: hypothetical protein VFK25_11075 [Candidatus Binatia bacterium]|nr:hypothetical protein [Candidatus Binatia bacterium]
MMTSSNNTGDSPIVFLTAGRTEQGFSAAQELAHMTANVCWIQENQTALEGLDEFIARRFCISCAVISSQQQLALRLRGPTSVQKLSLSAPLYGGFNYLDRAWAALLSDLEQNAGISIIAGQFIGFIEQRTRRAGVSGAVQEHTKPRPDW